MNKKNNILVVIAIIVTIVTILPFCIFKFVPITDYKYDVLSQNYDIKPIVLFEKTHTVYLSSDSYEEKYCLIDRISYSKLEKQIYNDIYNEFNALMHDEICVGIEPTDDLCLSGVTVLYFNFGDELQLYDTYTEKAQKVSDKIQLYVQLSKSTSCGDLQIAFAEDMQYNDNAIAIQDYLN